MTPAHDFNDFEVGKRQNLRMVNIFDPEARNLARRQHGFSLMDLPDSPDLTETMTLHGLDRFEARKRIVAMMEARELLAEIEDNTHTVPHGDRSGVPIEPYLTDRMVWSMSSRSPRKA